MVDYWISADGKIGEQYRGIFKPSMKALVPYAEAISLRHKNVPIYIATGDLVPPGPGLYEFKKMVFINGQGMPYKDRKEITYEGKKYTWYQNEWCSESYLAHLKKNKRK